MFLYFSLLGRWGAEVGGGDVGGQQETERGAKSVESDPGSEEGGGAKEEAGANVRELEL